MRPDLIKSGPFTSIAGQAQNIYMLLKDNEDDKETSMKDLKNTSGGTTTQANQMPIILQSKHKKERENKLNIDANMLVKQVEFQQKP